DEHDGFPAADIDPLPPAQLWTLQSVRRRISGAARPGDHLREIFNLLLGDPEEVLHCAQIVEGEPIGIGTVLRLGKRIEEMTDQLGIAIGVALDRHVLVYRPGHAPLRDRMRKHPPSLAVMAAGRRRAGEFATGRAVPGRDKGNVQPYRKHGRLGLPRATSARAPPPLLYGPAPRGQPKYGASPPCSAHFRGMRSAPIGPLPRSSRPYSGRCKAKYGTKTLAGPAAIG